jgi:hypothetical protein
MEERVDLKRSRMYNPPATNAVSRSCAAASAATVEDEQCAHGATW